MRAPRPVKIKTPRKPLGRSRKPRKARREVETPIHISIFEFLQAALLPGSRVHHSPNEFGMAGDQARSLVQKAKRMGMQPGWPDLEVFAAHHDPGAHDFFVVEVKTDDGSLSERQKDVRVDLVKMGVRYVVARSIDDVKSFLAWEEIPVRVRL